MADSTGRELTYGRALAGSLLIAAWVKKNCAADKMIGLLLPSSTGGALANIGVMIAGKAPVNLNFTAGHAAMASAIEQCGVRTIVTSKLFLTKAKIEAMDGCVFLEDILGEIGGFAKVRALAAARLVPARMLTARKRTPESLATVIFSSGSSGVPKGVMLSHHNVLSNIQAMAQVFWLSEKDRIVGVLPFFHSFGFHRDHMAAADHRVWSGISYQPD